MTRADLSVGLLYIGDWFCRLCSYSMISSIVKKNVVNPLHCFLHFLPVSLLCTLPFLSNISRVQRKQPVKNLCISSISCPSRKPATFAP